MYASIIEKESVATMRFVGHEVLSDKQEIILRRNKLVQAMTLGNLYKVKCKIFFHTEDGSNVVETTLWAVTDNHVMIKGGLVIPIHCIYSVETC